jgi:hypothetical protein
LAREAAPGGTLTSPHTSVPRCRPACTSPQAQSSQSGRRQANTETQPLSLFHPQPECEQYMGTIPLKNQFHRSMSLGGLIFNAIVCTPSHVLYLTDMHGKIRPEGIGRRNTQSSMAGTHIPRSVTRGWHFPPPKLGTYSHPNKQPYHASAGATHCPSEVV